MANTKTPVRPLDLNALRVCSLTERRSLTRVEDILLDPAAPPADLPEAALAHVRECAVRIRAAREHNAGVMMIFGAHLLRNGAARILDRMMERGWITHLATNGAATIHDWEYAWLGASTESVRENVANGTFGAWDETSTAIHLALMTGALDGLGYGRALGRFICEDGAAATAPAELKRAIRAEPDHPLAAARADLLRALRDGHALPRHVRIEHCWKHASVVAAAWTRGVPLTVHPGIGYDIIACNPAFSGSVIGRAAEWDFKLFAGSVDTLDGGVVLSIGSAVMGPQVFEKAASCVNNVRLQAGRRILHDHTIYVVDLQDGGGWDWSAGEPPKTNPAYYLRFCKSYARMGGTMRYVQGDNAAFVHHLLRELEGA